MPHKSQAWQQGNSEWKRLVREFRGKGWNFKLRPNGVMEARFNGYTITTHAHRSDRMAMRAFRKDMLRVELKQGGKENDTNLREAIRNGAVR